MKKTTVMINEELLRKAIQAIGARSAKEAIEAGLEVLVREHNREALRRELGTYNIDLDSHQLESLRNAE